MHHLRFFAASVSAFVLYWNVFESKKYFELHFSISRIKWENELFKNLKMNLINSSTKKKKTFDAKFFRINIPAWKIVDSGMRQIHFHICLHLCCLQKYSDIIYRYASFCFISPHVRLKVRVKEKKNPAWCGSAGQCGDGGYGRSCDQWLGRWSWVLAEGLQPESCPAGDSMCCCSWMTYFRSSRKHWRSRAQRPSRSAQHLHLRLRPLPSVVSRHSAVSTIPR